MRAASESPVRHIIPPEFLEPNWRFWSFVFISILGSLLIIMYKVPVYDGLTDPFYTPTVLILPLVVLFRLTCYAYRKDYHRHLFNHPNSCATDVRLDSKSRGYSGETGFFRIEMKTKDQNLQFGSRNSGGIMCLTGDSLAALIYFPSPFFWP